MRLAEHFISFSAMSLINSIIQGHEMFDSLFSHDIKISQKSYVWHENTIILTSFAQHY